MPERASWDQTWLAIARAMALRSRCDRDQVGAVVVDPMNRVVATAYNGPPASFPESPLANGGCRGFCHRAIQGPQPTTLVSYEDCPSLHAEANALMVCDRRDRLGGTIYTTSDICWSCAKLIANSGLARVVVPRDHEHDYRSSHASYEFLRRCRITVDYHEE